MTAKILRACLASVLASALMSLPIAGIAVAGKMPTTGEVLFEPDPLKVLSKGTKLTYSFERKVSNEKLLGPGRTDQITIDVQNEHSDGKRDIAVQIFTGEYAREVQRLESYTKNPVLALFLDRAVRNFSRLTGGFSAHLQNRFVKELHNGTKVEAVKATVGGNQVDAYRISFAPYENDPNYTKMQGYERSKFEFIVSNAVPGHLVELNSVYTSTIKSAPRLEEHIKFVEAGGSQ